MYDMIITSAQSREQPAGYVEVHHIIPKSMGGENTADNLVALTGREHLICHWLLTKIVITKKHYHQMVRALSAMSWYVNEHHQRFKLTPRLYETIKAKHAEMMSELISGENNPMYGKTHTDAVKEFIRVNNTGRTLTDAQKKKVSESKRGKKREQFSEEWIENLKKANSGEGNGMFGKTHSDTAKEKMREKALGRKVHPDVVAKRNADARAKGMKREKINCPHCNRDIAVNTYPRFHGDKCKQNTGTFSIDMLES